MKITAIDTTATPPLRIILADPNTKKIEGYHERPESSLEILDGTRWDQIIPADRANLKTTITFNVCYSLTTEIDAELELHDLRARTPTIARVELESASPTRRVLRWFDTAHIAITDLSYIGCTLFVSYAITGGAIQSA
jgi:hypothetical protein